MCRLHRAPLHRRAAGVTLVELMIAVSLISILLGLAVPSLTEVMAKMRLEGAVNNLATDLQFARSEALQHRTAVTLSTATSGTTYGISSAGTTVKTVNPGGVTFTGDVAVTFDPLRGLANTAVFTVSAAGTGAQLRVSTNTLGRVQVCTPAGFHGYPTC